MPTTPTKWAGAQYLGLQREGHFRFFLQAQQSSNMSLDDMARPRGPPSRMDDEIEWRE
jgi:hypothetical protein